MTDQRYAFLADIPDLSGFRWPEGGPEDIPEDAAPPKSRIHIARCGKFKHPRYGRFTVTRETYDSFVRNLADGLPTPELPVDVDHEPDLGGSTAACGWIKGLHVDGTDLHADVEWNWDGAWQIKEKRYKFVSPTWVMNYVDDEGNRRGPTLLAFALTNRPFFSKLASVSLSRTFSRDDFSFAAEDDTAAASSPPSARVTELFDALLAEVARKPGMAGRQAALRAQFARNPDLALGTLNELLRRAG
jgi:hypothetical protein